LWPESQGAAQLDSVDNRTLAQSRCWSRFAVGQLAGYVEIGLWYSVQLGPDSGLPSAMEDDPLSSAIRAHVYGALSVHLGAYFCCGLLARSSRCRCDAFQIMVIALGVVSQAAGPLVMSHGFAEATLRNVVAGVPASLTFSAPVGSSRLVEMRLGLPITLALRFPQSSVTRVCGRCQMYYVLPRPSVACREYQRTRTNNRNGDAI